MNRCLIGNITHHMMQITSTCDYITLVCVSAQLQWAPPPSVSVSRSPVLYCPVTSSESHDWAATDCCPQLSSQHSQYYQTLSDHHQSTLIMNMQTPGGQTLNDRLLAARHSLAGQGLAKAVCKATTEEIIGPKKKHLDCEYQWLIINHHHYWCVLDLLQCTNEPNVSIPTLANLLIERTLNPNWVVVYKSLITIHHLMCYGNEVTQSTNIWPQLTLQYFSDLLSIWHQVTVTSSWRTSSTRLEYRVSWNMIILWPSLISNVNQGLDKLQGAIAQAVYMDQGVKQNFERMRALGKHFRSVFLGWKCWVNLLKVDIHHSWI